MYANCSSSFGEVGSATGAASCLLSPGELDTIEQRARGVGGSYIHVPTVLALAQHDVPALLAEVRRLRARCEELREADLCAGA